MSTRVVVHESALRHLLRDESGPTGRYLSTRAIDVDRRARAHLIGHRRSGALEQTLRFAGIFQGPRGPYALVGTDATTTDQGRKDAFAYPVPLETGRDPSGRRRKYRYPFLEPALHEAFGKKFTATGGRSRARTAG